MNSFGVLGDLCREAEWIQRRIQCASRSIQDCQHEQLKDRLVAEISFYRHRCLAIQTTLADFNSYLDSQSIQKNLLEELLSRCLLSIRLQHRVF